jgi:hypothetical protein
LEDNDVIRSLKLRLATLTRVELAAGGGVALIVSGGMLRLFGNSLILPALQGLRSVSDEALGLFLHAFSLLQILIGIALLVLVAAHLRRRTGATVRSETTEPQP